MRFEREMLFLIRTLLSRVYRVSANCTRAPKSSKWAYDVGIREKRGGVFFGRRENAIP